MTRQTTKKKKGDHQIYKGMEEVSYEMMEVYFLHFRIWSMVQVICLSELLYLP